MSRVADFAAGLVTAAFACACAMFAWQPTLASFADDSVSYLVMAQVFSPYQPATPAVVEAFAREAFYPPLFPLLLALGGGAHNFAWAHALTALLLAAALPFAYLLGLRWLGGRGSALAAVACIALLPSLWINSKGILSEPLFCLLLMKTFWILERDEGVQAPAWQTALLMAAMALTRTAALPMIAVYALWALSRRGLPAAARIRAMAPAVAAIAIYGLWVLLRPSTSGDGYAHILVERGQGFLDGPGGLLSALSMSLLRQANAVVDGWAGSLMIFWVEGQPARFALASTAGILALAGLVLRIRRGKADGWLMAGYLATLLAWPFYEQMERFLFPALPVLVLYAFLAAGEAMRAMSRKPAIAHALLVGLLLSLSLPAMAFIRQRSQEAGRVALVTDWYRTPDLERARRRAQTHLDLFEDMRAIRSLTRPDERVMWVAPSYIALLADRRALLAPDAHLGPEAYREAVRNSGADYVFLSRYHPRDTIRDTAWQAGVRALSGSAKAVHTSTLGDGSTVTSVLLKVPK
ncbi:MAG TPA: hypothetical protein VMJ14_08680 [Burkholderiales bacterium]|nr:hypothetical protein [Burkholderiales bacterium]